MTDDYQVSWDSLPQSLKPEPKNRWTRFLWNLICILLPFLFILRFILILIRALAARLILPAVNLSEACCKESREGLKSMQKLFNKSHQTIRKWIQTPDGVRLRATLFKSIRGPKHTPTLIYFHGNDSLQGFGGWKWFLRTSIEKDVHTNLVVFDYRGTGESQGRFTKVKDLLIDCSSIVAWIRQGLKTLDSHIHFYGMSLGGALALKTKAMNPKLSGFLINERSFSNVEDLIYSGAILPRFLKPLIPMIMKCLKKQEMNLDPCSDLPKLIGKKLFVYHQLDPTIPYDASMARVAPKEDIFELREKVLVRNHHCEKLASYLHAEEKLFAFALNAIKYMNRSADIVR